MSRLPLIALAIAPAIMMGTCPTQPHEHPSIGPDALKSMVQIPDRWYAGFPLYSKLTGLWDLVDASHARTIRITPSVGKPYRAFINSKDGEVFRAGPPSWDDYGFECGSFPIGEATVTMKIDLLDGFVQEDETPVPLVSCEVKKTVFFSATLDEFFEGSVVDKSAAKKLRAKLGGGGVNLTVPDELKDQFAVRLNVLKDGATVASGGAYKFHRDDRWSTVELLDTGDPATAPVQLEPAPSTKEKPFPARPLIIEIVGDPEMVLRAGLKKFWAGRVLIQVD